MSPTTHTTTAAAPAITNETVQTLDIRKDIFIAASPDIAFAAVLEELGPGSVMPDGKPFPMKLEPWPGGRWYRDLGETGGHKYGHLWGHVQVIKAPTLLELTGPMPMSFPAINHVQYRLKAEAGGTRLSLIHRAMGLLPQELREGMPEGWAHGMNRIKLVAETNARTTASR
ncbi:MAG: SRPBCC domain-containing protein [Planctomycetes bacterium]|nr:SRPBCC domain-containing protein [Planctomycetota bacterium]